MRYLINVVAVQEVRKWEQFTNTHAQERRSNKMIYQTSETVQDELQQDMWDITSTSSGSWFLTLVAMM